MQWRRPTTRPPAAPRTATPVSSVTEKAGHAHPKLHGRLLPQQLNLTPPAEKCSRRRAATRRREPCGIATPGPTRLQPDSPPTSTVPHSVSCIQFRALFTLIYECFSNFLHSTSSLSVHATYLALPGDYLALHAPFTRNATRRTREQTQRTRSYGAITLHGVPFQSTWSARATSYSRPK